MSEFKVGDRVRLLANTYEDSFPKLGALQAGNFGTVTQVSYGGAEILVDNYSDHSLYFYGSEIDLYPEVEVVQDKETPEDEKPFARFDDEYVDDEDVFKVLQMLGIQITEEQYAKALDIAVELHKARH